MRKANGGKADALNAGINHARKELVCMVDADSLLDPQALLNVARPFADDPGRVVAAGGVVRVANGSRVDRGRVTDVRMPRRWLARIQVVEYLRAFLIGRAGWSRLGRAADHLRRLRHLPQGRAARGGRDGHRLHRRGRRARGPDPPDAGETSDAREVVFVPEPVAWTEVPETRAVLRAATALAPRAGRDLRASPPMLFRPRYGVIGMVTMPWFLFELLAPAVEVWASSTSCSWCSSAEQWADLASTWSILG